MSTTVPSLLEFLTDNCGMSKAVADAFHEGLLAEGIDGVKIAGIKARDGQLEPILIDIVKEWGKEEKEGKKDEEGEDVTEKKTLIGLQKEGSEEDEEGKTTQGQKLKAAANAAILRGTKLKGVKIDKSYVKIILSELSKLSSKDVDASLAKKQKEVDAVLAAARAYRKAAAAENKAAMEATYTTLEDAIQKVAPKEGWSVPVGKDLVEKVDDLIKDIGGLAEIVDAGDFGSDYQMLTEISEDILRKAAVFLPGKPVGHRAVKPLFNFSSDVTKNVLSETEIYEAQFSNNSVSASYKNDLTKEGNANTIEAEVGAFFGFGAAAITGSFSETSASEKSKRINTLTETHQAIGIKVHCVEKASVNINLDKLILSVSKEDKIITVHEAVSFLEAYGTHIITAPQILGGLYVLQSTVTFESTVQETSYKEALATTLKASESLHGWGAGESGIVKVSLSAAQEAAFTAAAAGGTTKTNDSYSAITTISMKGPSCTNAGAFRASLNHGNRSWAFVNNGLKFDKDNNRDKVVHQIAPVWKLFDRAERGVEAELLRKTWLDLVLDTDAIFYPNSFFSKLVHQTLHVDKLKADKADWTQPYTDKLAIRRSPPSVGDVGEKVVGETNFAYGGTELALERLCGHVVGFAKPNQFLTRFKLETNGKPEGWIRFLFETTPLKACGVYLFAKETEVTTTPSEGAKKECRFLDRHTVRAPEGSVLTGFQLMSDSGINVYYKYKYAQLFAGNVKFSYAASEVKSSETNWSDGADKSLMYLDRHDVVAPAGHLLLGFRLQSDAIYRMRYQFWHVPVSALKAESVLVV